MVKSRRRPTNTSPTSSAKGETITAIGRNLAAPAGAEVIDATGKLVFPGFIDPHVHIYLPFMGTYSKDDYDSGSRAALVGGTTTLIEMCCPSRTDEPLATFELWLSKAEGISACDYSFHMGVARYDESMEQQMREIVRRGIASFKVFLAYKGAFGIDDNELYRTLRLAKELGVIVTAHCENAELVAEMQAKLIAEGKTGPEWHEKSRPVRVEAEGVHHLTTFAEMTGHARLHRPHQQRRCDSNGRRRPAAGRARVDRNGGAVSGARRVLR